MELKANNISFSYNKKRQILKDFSISLNSNQVIGLMGDSGSGKSTLCKILAGYITNYSGDVTLDGKKIPDKGFYPVQLIFQHPEKTMNPKWKMQKVLTESWNPPQDLRDTFGLKDAWLTRWPSELSGGELQRFSILRALNPNFNALFILSSSRMCFAESKSIVLSCAMISTSSNISMISSRFMSSSSEFPYLSKSP